MSKAASRRNKLAELRALRASGKKAYDTYEVSEEQALYEEVDENEYKKIVRERLNQDDFVVDDNGEGYADDGREDWDRVHTYGSESEDDVATGHRDRKSGENLLAFPARPKSLPAHAPLCRQTKTKRREGEERCR